jgi:hypothetical protein
MKASATKQIRFWSAFYTRGLGRAMKFFPAFPFRILENSTILKNVKTVFPCVERRFLKGQTNARKDLRKRH